MVVYAEMCSRLLRTSITAGPSVASAACSAGPASCAALTVNPAAPNAWASAAKSGLTSPVAFSRRGCGSRYGSRRGGVVEYVGHQRGNSGLVANRRKLFGRAPDEAQALKGGQGRLHLRRVRVRGEAGGNRELQLLVGQRRRGLRAVCHALGDGQPAGLIQLQLPILVVAGDQRGHGRPRRTRVGGGQPGSSACSRSRPVRAGGVARAPGVNRRCSAVVMSTNVTYMPVRRRVGHQHVRRRHPGPAGPQSEGWRGSLRSKRNEAKENSQKQGEKYA